MATRHERVIIDLDDRFTGPMARMAASTSLFRKSLDDSGRSTMAFDRTVKDTEPSIDKLSGRLAIMGRAAAALGPGLVPITAAAIPAVAGLSTQLGFAAAGAGVAMLAFKGMGEALKAVNTYQLEPTQANFEAMQKAMQGMGPAAREFVAFLDQLGPKLQVLRTAAQDGILPGAQQGIESLMTRLPQVRRIIAEISDTAGDLLSGAGSDLASSRWDKFFNFLETQARPTLIELGRTAGNVAHGLAEMWMALSPASQDFTGGLLKASQAFDQWATSLSKTQGFRDFLAYLHDTSPQVLATLGSVGNALLQVVEAAAPMGGPILRALQDFADVIAKIADSPIGTPLLALVGAFSALRLATSGWDKVLGSSLLPKVKQLPGDLRVLGASLAGVQWDRSAAGAERYAAATSRLGNLGKTAAVVGGLALATSGLAEKTGLSNTASLALMGTIAGPWGAAIGGGIGLAKDFAHANDNIEASLKNVDNALASNSLEQYRAALAKLQADTAHLANDKSGLFGFTGNFNRVSAFLSGANGDIARKAAYLQGEIKSTATATGGLASLFGSALGPGLQTTAHNFEIAAMSANSFESSLKSVNAFLSGRANFRDYQAALDTFTAGLKENGKAFHNLNASGRANNANLDAIASSALKVAENFKGLNRINFLDKARGNFVDAAKKMGYTATQAQHLADKAHLLDKSDPTLTVKEQGSAAAGKKVDDVKGKVNSLDKSSAHPKVQVLDLASTAIARIQANMNRLTGKTVVVRTVHMDTRLGGPKVATGGAIYGPGTGTSDSIPAWLSNGEYVIKAAAVAKYGTHMFDRLNAMAFADGGSVDQKMTAKQRAAAAKAASARRAAAARTRNNAMFSFDLQAGMSTDRVASEFHSFRNALHLGQGALHGLEVQAKGVTTSYLQHEAALKADRKSLDDLIQERDQYGSSVTSAFTRDAFGHGVFGVQAVTAADTRRAQAEQAALKTAASKGLGGIFARDLAASGDTVTAQQLAAMTREQIMAVQKQYEARAAAVGSLASYSTSVAFDKQIAVQSKLIASQTATLKALNKSIEKIEKRAQEIHVHGVTNPSHVAKEVARRQRNAGAR